LLGGNPPEEPEKVKESGGLHVIGTERHEARRIDNQLRGRAGRQGDPGSSRFFLSLEDDLLRIFNGDRIKSIMTRLNVPEDQPIELGLLSRAVEEAQSKVEGAHFDSRKHLLEYDDVLNKQRAAVYHRRNDILVDGPQKTLADAAIAYLERLEASNLTESDFAKLVADAGFNGELETQEGTERVPEHRFDALREKIIKTALEAAMHPDALRATLSVLDGLWMDHLENLDALSESVGLRAYGQHDPLAEYRNEAKRLYDEFWTVFDTWALMNIQKIAQAVVRQGGTPMPQPSSPALQKQEAYPGTGRNDPCPCGSGKKYKKCHGA
jgi:preprotein translocase subunit SecA